MHAYLEDFRSAQVSLSSESSYALSLHFRTPSAVQFTNRGKLFQSYVMSFSDCLHFLGNTKPDVSYT